MIKTLQDFLTQSTINNTWIKFEGNKLAVYIRQGPRIINREKYFCFDIANIEAKNPGKGAWKRFLIQLEGILSITKHEIIYVENVLNPRFALSLVEHYGFTEIQPVVTKITDFINSSSFYKKVVK